MPRNRQCHCRPADTLTREEIAEIIGKAIEELRKELDGQKIVDEIRGEIQTLKEQQSQCSPDGRKWRWIPAPLYITVIGASVTLSTLAQQYLPTVFPGLGGSGS